MPVPALRPAIAWIPVQLYASFHLPVFSDPPVAFPALSILTGIRFHGQLFSVLQFFVCQQTIFPVRFVIFSEPLIPTLLPCFLMFVLFAEIPVLSDVPLL